MSSPENVSTFYRRSGMVALVGTAILLPASALIQPDLSGGSSAMLAAVRASGWRDPVSVTLFMVGQLFNLVAVATIGLLLRHRSPRLGAVGTAVAVTGAFAEAVYSGASLTIPIMAADPANAGVYSSLLDRVMTSPLGIVTLTGLVGSVVGLLLLSIGLFRAQVGPRWVGPAIWAFLLLEYGLSEFSSYAGYLGVLLCGVAYLRLAQLVARSGSVTAPEPTSTSSPMSRLRVE